jgi:hypothetical protein
MIQIKQQSPCTRCDADFGCLTRYDLHGHSDLIRRIIKTRSLSLARSLNQTPAFGQYSTAPKPLFAVISAAPVSAVRLVAAKCTGRPPTHRLQLFLGGSLSPAATRPRELQSCGISRFFPFFQSFLADSYILCLRRYLFRLDPQSYPPDPPTTVSSQPWPLPSKHSPPSRRSAPS